MSRRIDPSWTVFTSIENAEHDRCVDVFSRPDGTYGFEEFRRDCEDRGEWTPVQHFSGMVFDESGQALATAEKAVPWLAITLLKTPSLRKLRSGDKQSRSDVAS